MGTVSGWGLLNETHSDASEVLQYVSVPGNYWVYAIQNSLKLNITFMKNYLVLTFLQG